MPGTDDLLPLLETLCPMHAILDHTGHITSAGPTLTRLHPARPLVGCRFLEVFDLRRPRDVTSMKKLRQVSGKKLKMRFRRPPHTGLKGVMVSTADGGGVVNLSFGIAVLEAVQDYALTVSDFAATDLAIEMLYLVEAKTAAMTASRMLNQRLQGAKIAAEEQAFTDTLTGLKNRRALDHILSRLIGARVPFALLHLDLDYFKDVNDTLGHAAGDRVLQEVARVMVAETRAQDTVARVGGDEFVLVIDLLQEAHPLRSLANRLIHRLKEPILYQGQTCRISASVGIAVSRHYVVPDPDQIAADADAALYAAKHAGRGRACLHAPGKPISPLT